MFATCDEIQESIMGQLDGDWEKYLRFQGAYFEGD